MDAVAKTFLVGGGGFIGANARYWLGAWLSTRAPSDFPWATLLINVSGSLLIGLLLGLAGTLNWNQNWRVFGAVGVLGGYTTYSSFAYEAIRLIGDKQYARALFYIEGTALLTVLGAWLGLVLAGMLTGGKA